MIMIEGAGSRDTEKMVMIEVKVDIKEIEATRGAQKNNINM